MDTIGVPLHLAISSQRNIFKVRGNITIEFSLVLLTLINFFGKFICNNHLILNYSQLNNNKIRITNTILC